MLTGLKIVSVVHVLSGLVGLVFIVGGVLLGGAFDGSALSVFVLALLASLPALTVAIGLGLWHKKAWARTGAITLAIVYLFTGVGALMTILTLIVLFNAEVRALFVVDGTGDGAPRLE